jgi:hypothetical protein
MAISKRLRYEILRRDNYTCRYCGATAPNAALTIDHVIPEALGGGDDPSNLVAACSDCNGGKSASNPDATLVADVAADALRWAEAMAVVAQERAAHRVHMTQIYDKFLAKWNTWTYRRGIKDYTVDIPGGWQQSISRFIEAGLELDDLSDLIDVAMGARTPDPWRYFCGCAWRRIKESQEAAREVLDVWDAYDENNDQQL